MQERGTSHTHTQLHTHGSQQHIARAEASPPLLSPNVRAVPEVATGKVSEVGREEEGVAFHGWLGDLKAAGVDARSCEEKGGGREKMRKAEGGREGAGGGGRVSEEAEWRASERGGGARWGS